MLPIGQLPRVDARGVEAATATLPGRRIPPAAGRLDWLWDCRGLSWSGVDPPHGPLSAQRLIESVIEVSQVAYREAQGVVLREGIRKRLL